MTLRDLIDANHLSNKILVVLHYYDYDKNSIIEAFSDNIEYFFDNILIAIIYSIGEFNGKYSSNFWW